MGASTGCRMGLQECPHSAMEVRPVSRRRKRSSLAPVCRLKSSWTLFRRVGSAAWLIPAPGRWCRRSTDAVDKAAEILAAFCTRSEEQPSPDPQHFRALFLRCQWKLEEESGALGPFWYRENQAIGQLGASPDGGRRVGRDAGTLL